ncbi:archaeosortase/exosortase family protein [Kitasatospora sp. NPDC057692]|uniref:archaeosortase/exosortase family protein n=1 Tax=Kitasatospora sp. NPDC057692 TaxID=3346215 RepID=UPI0036B171F6
MTESLSHPLAPRRHAAARARRSPVGMLCGAVLLGVCGSLVAGERAYRSQESRGTAWLVEHLLGMRTLLLEGPTAPVLYAGDRAGLDRGVALTTGCSSALLIAPLALVTALLLLFGNRRAGRVLLAFGVAAGLVLATNLARLTLVLVMQHRYGAEGFGWTHVLFGSVLMMAAALGAALLYLRLLPRSGAAGAAGAGAVRSGADVPVRGSGEGER